MKVAPLFTPTTSLYSQPHPLLNCTENGQVTHQALKRTKKKQNGTNLIYSEQQGFSVADGGSEASGTQLYAVFETFWVVFHSLLLQIGFMFSTEYQIALLYFAGLTDVCFEI